MYVLSGISEWTTLYGVLISMNIVHTFVSVSTNRAFLEYIVHLYVHVEAYDAFSNKFKCFVILIDSVVAGFLVLFLFIFFPNFYWVFW